jgi:hypothetical protein
MIRWPSLILIACLTLLLAGKATHAQPFTAQKTPLGTNDDFHGRPL